MAFVPTLPAFNDQRSNSLSYSSHIYCYVSIIFVYSLQLPEHLWLEVFSFVAKKELVNSVQYVCKAWHLLSRHASLWNKIRALYITSDWSGHVEDFLKKSKCLEELFLNTAIIDSFEFLCRLTNLKAISFRGYIGVNVSKLTFLQAVQSCQNLVAMDLSGFSNLCLNEVDFLCATKDLELLCKVVMFDTIYVSPATMRQFIKYHPCLACMACDVNGQKQDWADIIETHLGNITFGHNIIDFCFSYLSRQRCVYSLNTRMCVGTHINLNWI